MALDREALPLSGYPVKDGLGMPPDDDRLLVEALLDTGAELVIDILLAAELLDIATEVMIVLVKLPKVLVITVLVKAIAEELLVPGLLVAEAEVDKTKVELLTAG